MQSCVHLPRSGPFGHLAPTWSAFGGVPAYTEVTMATTTGPDAVVFPDLPPPPPPPKYRGPEHAAWKPPLGPVRKTIREIGWDLITAGLVVLLFVVYQLWGTGFAEAASQNKLKNQFAAPSVSAPAKGGSTGGGDNSTVGGTAALPVAGPPEGSAVAHLVIPKIGVDKYVVQGV